MQPRGHYLAPLYYLTNKNNRGRLLARKANRVATRSNRQQLKSGLFTMDSRQTRSSYDPPHTSNDILVSKVIRITTNAPASGNASISTTQVLGQLGSATAFSHFRFKKIEVWSMQSSQTAVIGSDAETLVVTIPGVGTAGHIPGGDQASFADNGSFGLRRPQVNVTPPTLVQQRWIRVGAVGEPDLLAQVKVENGESSGTALIVHVHCELRMPASTS